VGPLGRSVEQSEGKDRESVVAIPRFLCGSPHLYRLRTEGLVPVSKYWTYRSHAGVYGPIKLSSMLSIDAGFHLLLHWLAWERNRLWPVNYSAGLGVASGALILGSSRIHLTLLTTTRMIAMYVNCPQEAYVGRTWTDVRSAHVMLIGFFPAGCTSIQITMTLRYE
jgi:hypothetical protein